MRDLRNVETFVWVAQLGGFRAAADKLGATQPAVSARIAALEAELGASLFDRDGRGTRLTPTGGELLGYAQRMLQLQAEMRRAARDDAALRGAVRLGVAETIVHTWLSRLIERLHARHPMLVLEIEVDTTANLRRSLIEHRLDIAFLVGPLSEPRMKNVALCEYPLAWAASPALDLGPPPVALATLARRPIVTYARRTRPYQALEEMLLRAGVPDFRIYANSSISTMIRMARDGIGVAVVPPAVIGRELAEKSLRLVAAERELDPLAFTASFPLKPDSLLAATVAALAREVAAEEGAPKKRRHR